MGSTQLMSPERTWDKDLPDSSRQDHNEHKKAGGVIAGEGQGLCEENESGIQDAPKDLKNSQTRDAAPLVRQLSGRSNQQPQPPGQIIRWERFLPFRTLKVLLVENDDSTRHVISALLCNCSYQVTAVANGLQAWRILQDLTNDIDLVLTEVIMPGLNGIGLLNKIMNHITCRSIPVIMMSSHDSMGTVLKCLFKGAVDFLVKPIRKNELKNLWQHVWRRCHSSSGSGSGSESGTQTQKSVKSKSLDDSDNSRGSNNDKTASIHLNARASSDNGSGTQSSWTKRAAEVSSPQNMSSSDQLADPLDSTCALVIHAANDMLCKDHMPTSANREKQDKQELSDDCTGNDSEIGECKNLERQCETPLTEQDLTKQTGKKVDRLPEKGSKNECCLGSLSTNILNEPIAPAANLIGAIASSFDSQVVSRVIQAPSGLSKASLDQDKVNCALSDSASIELSLKRLRSIGETRTSTQDERNVLRRLDLSAFSRYNKSDASNQPQIGYGRSFSPLDNSSEAIKTGSTYNIMLNTAPLEQGSNGSSNNNDIGSTAKNTFRKPLGMKEKTASTSIVKCIHSSAFYSVQFRTLENQDHLQGSVENLTAPSATGKGKEIQHQVPSQHHHLHHSNPHHYHYVHSIRQPTPDQNDLTLKSKAEESPQCGSSNVFNGPFEGNAANYSVNGSNSGSNHGSNGNNDNNNATRTGGSNTESANDIAEQSGSGSGNGSRSSSGSGTDQIPLTHREAALKKFREKRKERNYGKKVRYQSRKRLVEQRPRVHGQFARKSVHEQTSGDADR